MTNLKYQEVLGGDKSRKPLERDAINTEEGYEVQAWCEMFGVTIVDLKRAIEAVGPSAVKVKHYLKDKSLANALSLEVI